MVKGRPVRSCTKNSIIHIDSFKRVAKLTNGSSNKNGSPKKSESITDYFQAVNISEDILKESLPLSELSKEIFKNSQKPELLDVQCEALKDSVKQDTEDSVWLIDDNIMTLNDIKSPSTPHRITLCTDGSEQKPDGEIEVKNFQKPITAPKARRKLNNNRFNLFEDTSLAGHNHKLTDYFPVRRSVRKTKTTVLEEKQRSLEKALRANVEDGLKICYFEEKGRGIVTDKPFKKGDFVVEYSGDLIEVTEAKKREEMYALDQNTGCYMYYFKHNNQQYCIDATPESDRLGRLVNHSRNGNLLTRSISVDGKPRLVLIAKNDIQIGEEILYDYGDRSKESLRHHPWLAN